MKCGYELIYDRLAPYVFVFYDAYLSSFRVTAKRITWIYINYATKHFNEYDKLAMDPTNVDPI